MGVTLMRLLTIDVYKRQICGRAGSKGFKNKNLKTFCGHPLVYYSRSAAELFIKKHPELHIDIALTLSLINILCL